MIAQNSGEVEKYHQISGGSWNCLSKEGSSNAPKGRFNQISFIYKNKLYIYGGSTLSSIFADDDSHHLYCFAFQSKMWFKLQTQSINKQFHLLNGYCWAVITNKLYIFGGIDKNLHCSNKLWTLNLDKMEWAEVRQFGQIPSSRQSACMIAYNQNWLLLYGGVNRNQLEIYNTFHFLSLQTKKWHKCIGNYEHLVHPRCHSDLCLLQGVVYLFGGEYRNLQAQQKYLNDLYKIQVHIIDDTKTPEIIINRIVVNSSPQARSGHTLLPLTEQYLLLIGGQSQSSCKKQKNTKLQILNDVWIFSLAYSYWVRLQVLGSFFKNRASFSCSKLNQQIYVFGGLMNHKKALGDLMVLNLSDLNLKHQLFVNPKLNCRMCYENNNSMVIQQQPISANFIDEIVNGIQFPFAAIGLLIDNAYNMSATYLNINLYQNSLNEKFYQFQENSKLWPTQQLKQILLNFKSTTSMPMQNLDKKLKAAVQKQNQCREYGSNLKLGCLRLGSELLYISNLNNQEIRVFLLKKSSINNQTECYYSYFYAYSLASGMMTMGNSNVRSMIQEQYSKYIEKFFNRKKICNMLWIFNLRKIKQGSEDLQLHPSSYNNDLVYGDRALIADLQKMGYLMCECIDASLRAYISSLFIKNQTMSIFLGVIGQSRQIHPQMYLQNIDRLCRLNSIKQIQGMVDFDCKITELYWNPDLSKQVQAFHNGILLYHRNRLITRFKYDLGDLIPRKIHKILKCCNLVHFFGYIQLPDTLSVNVFKSDFIFSILLEKLHQRLMFVNKFLKKQQKFMIIANDEKKNKRKNAQNFAIQCKNKENKDKCSIVQEVQEEIQDQTLNINHNNKSKDNNVENGIDIINSKSINEQNKNNSVNRSNSVNSNSVNSNSVNSNSVNSNSNHISNSNDNNDRNNNGNIRIDSQQCSEDKQ